MPELHAVPMAPSRPGGNLTAAAWTVTLGLAAAGWVATVRRASGMDAGVATDLGSFGPFIASWTAMTAAMMLPAATGAVLRRARADGGVRGLPVFVGSYLALWTLVGVVAYPLYRPHGTLTAGAAVIVAGLYELTPIKRRFRSQCIERIGSGFELGWWCMGSTIGLMVTLFALGVMNLAWMITITAVVVLQKATPPKAAVDRPLALAIVALGVLVIAAPAAVPGLTPPM